MASLEQTSDEAKKMRQLLRLLDEDLNENLAQNAQIMTHARQGDADLVKALHLLEREHPAYALVFAARGHIATIKLLEEGEECRQKGAAGLFDRYAPILKRLIEDHLRLKALEEEGRIAR